MKNVKKYVSIALIAVMTVISSGTAFAATAGTPDNMTEDKLSKSDNILASMKECVANSIMLSETIEKFENDYNISFEVKPENITSEMINVNAEWLADANQFLDSYINTAHSKSAKTTSSVPNAKQTAKAEAMMYSMNRAAFSLQRNPGLDFAKETQYMFLSHYIDREEYYWSTEEERLLLDGASMSGENGYLADWLTSSDRQSYNSYLGYSGFNTALQRLGNIAVDIYSYKGTPNEISSAVQALKKANTSLKIAHGMVLQDPAISIPEAINVEILPLVKQTLAKLLQDPDFRLSEIYNRYMGDEGLMSSYNEPDKSEIVRTSLAIVGAFLISGPAGAITAAVGTIVSGALSFNTNIYANFFNYAAWVAMRYGFSGRYANRTWYYIMGEDM